jgi:hypothetical protein
VPSVAPLDFDLDLSTPPPLPRLRPAQNHAPVGASLPKSAYAPAPTTARPAPPLSNGHAATPVDLENDFDTAPGALTPNTLPGNLSDVDNTRPAMLRNALPADSGFIEFDMSALAGLPAGTDRPPRRARRKRRGLRRSRTTTTTATRARTPSSCRSHVNCKPSATSKAPVRWSRKSKPKAPATSRRKPVNCSPSCAERCCPARS